jgi:thiol:disulfide interchange protein DsbG
MQKRFLAALIGSTLLTSAHTLADSQCTPAVPAQINPSETAVASAPASQTTTPAPIMPSALAARFQASQPPPGPPAPQPFGSSAPPALPADRAAGAGLHELSPGELAQIPGLKPIAAAGGRIFMMGRAGDAPDLVAFRDHDFQFVSPMADPHFVCRGVVSDEQGNNVSLTDAAKVPGLIAPPDRPVLKDIATPAEAIATIAKAAYGSLGPAAAPPVWVVVDPLCPHSQDTVHALIPYAQAGQVKLNILPVDAFGQVSAHAVRVLLSGAPDHMIQDWFQPGLLQPGAAQPSPESDAKFQANHMVLAGLMDGPMHVTGVPAVLWTAHDGQAHAQQGLDAPNVPAFINGLGN